MSYEREQRQLQALLEDTLTGQESSLSENESETEDHVEHQTEDTDSEQDLEDYEVNEESTTDTAFYEGKDRITKWNKSPFRQSVRTRGVNVVRQFPGPKGSIRNEHDALVIWRYFIDQDIIENIVKYTNEYIDSVKHRYSRETYARPTNKIEIECLIGMLLLSGVKKSNNLNAEELFRTDGGSVEIFRLAMSLQRFRFLLRYLRFDDVATRRQRKVQDKLCPVRDMFERFVSNCQRNYTLSSFVTVDEKLEAFYGKCEFRQYIPNKPNPYGLKVQALCDAKMYYTFNLEIYSGKQPEDSPYKVDNSGLAVGQRLCEPIYNSGRNVTMDNWYTSIPLAKTLLEKGLTMVGTIKKNKKEIPEVFNSSRGRSVKSNLFGFRENMVLVSHIPKKGKNVLLLSTMHKDNKVDPATQKPDVILSYNDTKGGVDVVDRLCANYNCARAARRWPMVIFYSLLNISTINSQVIYTANSGTANVQRRKFIEDLSMRLIEPHLRERQKQTNLPRNIRLRITEILKIDEPSSSTGPMRQGRCFECGSKKNRKTKYSCKKCKKYLCLEHAVIVCSECCASREE